MSQGRQPRKSAGSARGKLTMLPIEKIRVDGGTQMREKMSDATIAEYAEALAAGAKFPPAIVFYDGADYWAGDCFHRLAAHRRIKRKMIHCEVRAGDARAAILFACGANANHGLRRSVDDKRKAARTLLADPEWKQFSDREIARRVGVSHTFVSAIRNSSEWQRCHSATLPPAPESGAAQLVSPLKWHGGKSPLARRIVGIMPPHTTYVEPFAGGAAVLLAKSPDDVSEILNDIDGLLMNFWNVLRDEKLFKSFLRMSQATPFSEPTWEDAEDDLKSSDRVVRAWGFFVRNRQSLAGRMKSFAPLSITRTRQGMNEQCAAWLSAIAGLPAVHERLSRVSILRRDALKVIELHDSPNTLFYLDPPYVPESRTAPEVYAHEMTIDQHRELLRLITRVAGKVILSGYPNDLYARELKGWQLIETDRANSAAGGDSKRRMTEALWCNFPLQHAKGALAA